MPPRAASQTPGPTTRLRSSRQSTPQPASQSGASTRPTALPAASVGTSSGYGAPGKPVIRTQIATEETTLTTLLQNSRGKRQQPAIEEEEEEEDEDEGADERPVATASSRRGRRRPSSSIGRQLAQPAVAHTGQEVAPPRVLLHRRPAGATPDAAPPNVDADVTEVPRIETLVDIGAGYAEHRNPGLERNPGIERNPGFEPDGVRLAAHMLPRFIPRALREFNKDVWSFFRAILVLLLLAATIILSAALIFGASCGLFWLFEIFSVSDRLNTFFGRNPVNMDKMERLWLSWRAERDIGEYLSSSDLNKTTIDWLQTVKINDLEFRVRELEREHKINTKSVIHLEKMLPEFLATPESNGYLVIPDNFWRALQDRLLNERSALWKSFVDSTQAGVQAITQARVDDTLSTLHAQGKIVSREEFAEAVAQNYEYMQRNLKDEMHTAEHAIGNNLRKMALEAADNAVSTKVTDLFSNQQLKLLAQANQVRSTYEALRQVNFFSPGHGARVNPVNTSPTFGTNWNWLGWSTHPGHPPIAALQRWEEATECWCAAPSADMGSAQLTVDMNHMIFPEKLIVEHIPFHGTLNISTAPRELEIWLEMPKDSPNSIETLRKTVLDYGGQSETCGNPPSEKHICVGAGRYQIHTENTVQTIPMFVDTAALGLATRTITVRVSSNWGGPSTCLYRLRMTGTRVTVT
ncbi:hypothetical protein LTR62_000952 [Meristemomyces frigidus]|uniref:SUN domain-containing protein n=1 Tax=Meristemomyces frigidus TaxID=1508187 RepID=A0AAN7T9S4_9PEZI|nr:hypothetical protein LTR62_000952 [Meristemomyces frigidus]